MESETMILDFGIKGMHCENWRGLHGYCRHLGLARDVSQIDPFQTNRDHLEAEQAVGPVVHRSHLFSQNLCHVSPPPSVIQ